MIVKNPANEISATKVLINAGFIIISDWYNENIFEKNNKRYGIDHPVWDGKKVRLYKK